MAATAWICWKAANHLWEQGNTVSDPASLLLMLATWVVSFGLLALAVAGIRRPALVIFIPVALSLVFVDYAHAYRVRRAVGGPLLATDAYLFNDYAAELILDGRNPYPEDLSPAFESRNSTREYSTPLLGGGITRRLPYPALAPLLFVPFRALGIPTGGVYPFFFLLTALTVFALSPPRWQPLVLLPLFAEQRYLHFSFGGVSDIVWAWLLCLVVASWRKDRWAGVFYGLACAFKQHAWFLAPFFAIRLWRLEPSRFRTRASRFYASAFVAFLLPNLPFLLADAGSWLAGVTEPGRSPLISFGSGLTSLHVTGISVLPKVWLDCFQYGALALTAWIYWRHFERVRSLIWLAPAMALWFGNRSLSSYWYYFAIPLVLSLVRELDDPAPEPTRASDWRPTLRLVGGFLAVVLTVVVFQSRRGEPFHLELLTPGPQPDGWVRQIELRVCSRLDEPLRPRFTVQSWANQPFFWDVVQGPEQLGAGEEALYRLGTDTPHEWFFVGHGARISVASADVYHHRTTVRIPPARSLRFPGSPDSLHLRAAVGAGSSARLGTRHRVRALLDGLAVPSGCP